MDDTRDEQDTKETRTPVTGPGVDDIVAMVDNLTKTDRNSLLKALRALYGNPK